MTEIKIGDKVANFSLPSDNGNVDLSSFEGKNLVIYFYPKDDTPGCTIEAKDFTCVIDDFSQLNTVIIGISRDSITKHKKFKDNHQLKHILLSDVDGEVCQKFGCWVEKSMFGKKYMGIARKTFLLDKERKIVKIWPNVNVKGHVEEVLSAVKKL